MKPKLKRIIGIIGLVFMGLFLVSMFMYLIRSELFGGMLWLFAVLCFGGAIVMFCAIYFTRGFPSQQAKDEELKKAEAEYYKRLSEKETDKAENADAAKGSNETPDENKPDKSDDTAQKSEETEK